MTLQYIAAQHGSCNRVSTNHLKRYDSHRNIKIAKLADTHIIISTIELVV